MFGFGLTQGDASALRSFTDAVDRWQSNPEFRALAVEYSVRGSEALRTRPLLVPADRLIIVARSCPLLPERYGLTPTCRLHYEDFSLGPLAAYLHLCDEQAVHHVVGMVEHLARQAADDARSGGAAAADVRAFLGAFRLDTPVVKDGGAVQSVLSLLADTRADAQPFQYRNEIGPALAAHVQALAQDLGFPADLRRMTIAQQRVVLERLDRYVRLRDPELWRTKQVSDFCAGIWAHIFGRSYNLLIKPYLALHAAGRAGLLVLLLWVAVRWVRVRQAATVPAGAPEHAFSVREVVPRAQGATVTSTVTSAHARARARPAGSRRRRA
jgi:hypothetical protein